MHDPLNGELGRLVALAPPEYGRVNALVRQTCAKTLSLPPLPAEVTVDGPDGEAESVVVEFAEQFSVDVSSIDDDLRARFTFALGNSAFPVVVLTYLADYLPRVRAGLEALGVPVPWTDAVDLGSRQRSGRRALQPVSPGRGPVARPRPGDN